MRCWCISDTHGKHDQLEIPDGIDMVIHAGDGSNTRDPRINSNEMTEFLLWFQQLPVGHKIFIAGNHDTSVEARMVRPQDFRGINYFEHDADQIAGFNVFGSPFTPTYNKWSFMKSRQKIGRYWETLPEGLDVLITHGPPKYVLDLSYSPENVLEACGDSALRTYINKMEQPPRYHIFGHIHNCEDIWNQGIRIIGKTTYINASVVTDGEFNKGPSSNGVIIDL